MTDRVSWKGRTRLVNRCFEDHDCYQAFVDAVGGFVGDGETGAGERKQRRGRNRALEDLENAGILVPDADEGRQSIDWAVFTGHFVERAGGDASEIMKIGCIDCDRGPYEGEEIDAAGEALFAGWVEKMRSMQSFIAFVRSFFMSLHNEPMCEDSHQEFKNLRDVAIGFSEALVRYVPADLQGGGDDELVAALEEWAGWIRGIMKPADFHFRSAMDKGGLCSLMKRGPDG